MTIRPGNTRDLRKVVEMCRRLHLESAYRFLRFRPGKLRIFLDSCITQPERRCLLVAEDGRKLAGAVCGYITDYFFSDERVASDLFLWVEPEYRGSLVAARLVRAFRAWATTLGAREFCLGVSSGIHPARTGAFYERMGLAAAGTIYKQRLR